MEKMKPCWHCEEKELLEAIETYVAPEDDEEPVHFVQCHKCYAFGPICDTESEAIATWNTRPREDELEFAVKTVADFVRESERTKQAMQAVKYQNVIDDLREELNTRPREPQWISVEDSIPAEGSEILAKTKDGSKVLGDFYFGNNDTPCIDTGCNSHIVEKWMYVPGESEESK